MTNNNFLERFLSEVINDPFLWIGAICLIVLIGTVIKVASSTFANDETQSDAEFEVAASHDIGVYKFGIVMLIVVWVIFEIAVIAFDA